MNVEKRVTAPATSGIMQSRHKSHKPVHVRVQAIRVSDSRATQLEYQFPEAREFDPTCIQAVANRTSRCH